MASKTFSPCFSFRRLLAALGILSLAALVGLTGCERRSEALKLYKDAHKVWLFEKDLPRAEKMLLKAIEIDPTLTQPHVELAEIYLHRAHEEKGFYSEDKAARHLRETIRLAPNHIGAHYLMGVVAWRRGDFDLALKEFKAARRSMEGPLSVTHPPMWEDVVCREGLLLLDKGDVDGAEADFEEYRSEARNSACYHIGMLLAAAERGDPEGLERHAGWVSSNVKLGDPAAYEGLLHIWRGEPGKAIDIFEKRVEQLDADIPEINVFTKKRLYQKRHKLYREVLAWAYWKSGRAEEARALHQSSLEDFTPSAPEVFNLVLTIW